MNQSIDNFDLIKPLLKFNKENDFYFVQIFQRKKDNKKLNGLNSARTIKTYYINSIEYLESKYDEMKKLAEIFNARVMINLNIRNYDDLGLKLIKKILEQMENKAQKHIKNAFDSVCGKFHSEKNKKWIIDIDDIPYIDNLYKDTQFWKELNKLLNNIKPEGNKIIEVIPSKTGIHIISSPFDIRSFEEKYPDIDIQKNNPTNLYIP